MSVTAGPADTAPVSELEPTDAQLVRRVLEGEDAAFTLLTQRHKTWLFRFIRRYVGQDDDAFDVLQDSFVSAWSSLHRYDPERPFIAWMRQIALNKCRDRARRNALRSIMRYLSGELDLFASKARWSDPEASLAADESSQRLDAAIASLSRSLREPLLLTVFEGLSQRDAARQLGISEKAIESRLYRAKQQLARVAESWELSSMNEDTES